MFVSVCDLKRLLTFENLSDPISELESNMKTMFLHTGIINDISVAKWP